MDNNMSERYEEFLINAKTNKDGSVKKTELRKWEKYSHFFDNKDLLTKSMKQLKAIHDWFDDWGEIYKKHLN
tara:strand:- start:3206 stop:3421 length:216 start_codon:yes stop_codon:yes gene_type:complete